MRFLVYKLFYIQSLDERLICNVYFKEFMLRCISHGVKYSHTLFCKASMLAERAIGL
jgi:hypothetical protein